MLAIVRRIRLLSGSSALVALFLLFSMLAPSLVLASADTWNLFQHDTHHSGRSSNKGPNQPDVLWVVPFGDTGKPTTQMVAANDGTIYVGVEVTPKQDSTTTATTTKPQSSGHSGVFAFGKGNKVSWVSKVNGKVSGPMALGKDGTLYAVIGQVLVALNKKDGSAKWQVKLNGESPGGVMLGKDGTIYAGTVGGKSLYAVSSDGNVKWTHNAAGDIDSSPAIADDGTIYVTAKDMSLYAVNPNGSLKWTFKVTEPGTDQLSAPVIADDGTVYFGGNKDQGVLTADDSKAVRKEYLYAINPDGKEKWRFQAKGKTVNMPALEKDGTIVFSTTSINYTEERDFYLGDCFLQGVDLSGNQKWEYDVADNAIDGPPLIDRDDYIYVSSTEGQMTCLSRQGIMVWRAKIGGKVSLAPKDIFYIAAKGSVAAIIDKSANTEARNSRKLEDQISDSNSSSPLSYLIYIVPLVVAFAIGYIVKIRMSKSEAK